MRELIRIQRFAGGAQRNDGAVIVCDDLRMGIRSAEVVDCVQVCIESDGGNAFISLRRGKKSHDIGMLIHINALQPYGGHFLRQQVGQVKFPGAGRNIRQVFLMTGGVDHNIFQ